MPSSRSAASLMRKTLTRWRDCAGTQRIAAHNQSHDQEDTADCRPEGLAGHDAAAQDTDTLEEPDATEQDEDTTEDQWTFAQQRVLRYGRTVPRNVAVLLSTARRCNLFLCMIRSRTDCRDGALTDQMMLVGLGPTVCRSRQSAGGAGFW